MKNLLTNLFYECKGSMFFEHTQMFWHEKFRKEVNFDLNQHFVYVHKYKFTYVHKFAKQFNTPCASFFFAMAYALKPILQIINHAFREQQRHTFLLYFERIGITMTAWTAKQQVHRYDVLPHQHVELSYVRVLGMLNPLVSEILFAVMLLVLHLNPKRFMVLCEKSLVQFHQTPRCDIFQPFHLGLKFKFLVCLIYIQEERLRHGIYLRQNTACKKGVIIFILPIWLH